MLTRTEETDSDESSGAAADRRPAIAEDGGSDSVSNLQTVDEAPDEPWAIVSLGGHDLEDTAIANNLSGLDLNSVNRESGVSSLSGTNGIALGGQTILSSLGPDADDEDANDAIDGLLLPGPNPAFTASVTGENDGVLSIPDTVPSNIRSIRGVGLVNATTTRQTSSANQQQHNRKRDAIVLVCFAVLFLGVTTLASTWRRSALRLEAELAELRDLKKANAATSTSTGIAQTSAPPLFADRNKEEEATPFTFADNCYIKAKASVSLGSCGSEMRDNLHNASSRIRKRFKSFSRKFEEAFWSFGNGDGEDHGGNTSTGTFFSSSSFFSRPRNTAGGTSQTVSSFNKFWGAKRNCWNKASKQFASDLNAFANRASECVHQTLDQSNKAIEHGIWSFIDHARDAIEEGTSALRGKIKHDEGGEVSDPYRGDGANLMEEGFRIFFSNITSIRRIAREFPSLGSAK